MSRFESLCRAETALVAFVALALCILLCPLPPWVLDLGLAASLSVGLVLVVSALHLDRPLSLSSFPTLLLFATLFRLALNVGSTRMILGRGEAGAVIEAFGRFVAGGSPLVGAVVFAVITLIQLIVIAKGAERVAEVGARFTLDALPGKQLAIDADIRAGACTQAEGRTRRNELERESRFYGALDGAMKFVKGDAIAGLLITVVNILGGLIAGTTTGGLGLAEALETYALLSIGDGLVAQLPALLTALAAGVLVTRVSGAERGGGLAVDLVAETLGSRRSLFTVAGLLLMLAAAPGMPVLPFLALASAFGGIGLARRSRDADRSAAPPTASSGGPGPERFEPADDLVLELGPALFESCGRPLVARDLPRLRDALREQLGVPLPPFRVRPAALGGNGYRLRLLGVTDEEGVLPEGSVIRLAPEEAALVGLTGKPVALGAAVGTRLDPESARRAADSGAGLLEPADVLVARLEPVLRRRAWELFSIHATTGLLAEVERGSPAVVREVTGRFGAARLWLVLRRLLEEGVALRPLERILETLAAAPDGLEDTADAAAVLADRVRRALGRQLCDVHRRGGRLSVLVLDPLVEDALREATVATPDGPVVALEPGLRAEIVDALRAERGAGESIVLLVPEDLRRYLWRLATIECPALAVLAYREVPAELEIEPVGRLLTPAFEARAAGEPPAVGKLPGASPAAEGAAAYSSAA